MADIVLDSSIIIDYLRGRTNASHYLDQLRQETGLATHIVVVAEVLTGARDRREQDAIDRLFREFHVLSIQEADAKLSTELLKQYRLGHGVGWLDCLIAATCFRCGVLVATLNERHFATFEGLQVLRPY